MHGQLEGTMRPAVQTIAGLIKAPKKAEAVPQGLCRAAQVGDRWTRQGLLQGTY